METNRTSPEDSTHPKIPVRIGARVIDIIVLGAGNAALGKMIGFGFDWLLVSAAIVILYFTLMDAYAGATLGKLATGLRVIGPAGGRPSVRQAFLRESFTVVGAIPFAGPLLALAAWIWIFVSVRSNPLGQGKHDELAGGTRVIRR